MVGSRLGPEAKVQGWIKEWPLRDSSLRNLGLADCSSRNSNKYPYLVSCVHSIPIRMKFDELLAVLHIIFKDWTYGVFRKEKSYPRLKNLHAFNFHEGIDLIMEDVAACFLEALHVLSKGRSASWTRRTKALPN